MSRYIRTLKPWPLGTPLPGDGLFVLYDPAQDDEFKVLPEQIDGKGGNLPLNDAKSGQKFYRYRTRFEADQPGADGGAVLDELDYLTICTFAHVVVERYREDPTDLTEQPHYQELVAVFDGTPNAKKGWRDGSFQGDLIGLTLIKLEDFLVPVSTVNVPLLDPEKLDNVAGTTVHYAINSQERLFITANDGGPFPAPVDESGTGDWIPYARQVPPMAQSQAYDLSYARYVANRYPDAVVAGRMYLIKGPWDDGAADQVVSVVGVAGGFATTGTLLAGGVLSAVDVNVAAGTTAPAGGVSSFAQLQGQPRDNTALAAELDKIKLKAPQVTVAQMRNLMVFAKLDEGTPYILTDHQLTHAIPGTSDTWTGPVEPLVVYAASTSTLAVQGLSLLYPQDIIYYSITGSNYMPGTTKGYIFRRIDTLYGNDLPIDFRGVGFRRWFENFPKADHEGRTGGYTSATNNGGAYQDFPMFGFYFKCRNNVWSGLEKSVLGSDADYPIFNSINFVSDNQSRIVNSRLTNSKMLRVTLAGGTWFKELYLDNSGLYDVKAPHYQDINFFSGSLKDSTVIGRTIEGNEVGFSIDTSSITNEVIAGKKYIKGAEYAPGGAGAHTPPIFVAQDLAAYTLTVRPGLNYRYTELEASLNIATVTPTAVTAAMVQADGSIVLNTGAVDRAAGTVGVRARLAGGRAASAWTTNPQPFTAAATSPKPVNGLEFNTDGETAQRMSFAVPAEPAWGISVWFKRRTAWAESAYFFDARGAVSADVYVLDSNGVGVTITPGGSSALPGANLRYLNTGQFIRLFINGTGPVSAGVLQFFERYTGGEPMLEIELSDLRFYGRNFTAAEMADSTSASTDGLLRRYALESTSTGSVAQDLSGSNVNGTLTGF